MVVLIVIVLVLVVVLPIVGWALWLLISAAVVGAIIGGLARLVLPGRQEIGVLNTIFIGWIGSLIGSLIGRHLFHVGSFLTVLCEIAVAAILVAIASSGAGNAFARRNSALRWYRPAARYEASGLDEADLRQWAVRHPLSQDCRRPRAVRSVAGVELLDKTGKDPLPLSWIGDDLSDRRQIGDNVVLQVKDELRISAEICQPISWPLCRDAAEINRIFKSVKANLDSPGCSRASTGGGDVDGPLGQRRGWADLESLAYFVLHI
jgi:uncharacterized membrane protein YeaQ/YmgE (transglycosylase-associated protein family)